MSRATLLKLLGPKQRRERDKMEKFKSQARFANSTGRNRTNDFLMPSSVGDSVLARMGRGNGKAGPQKQFSEQPLPMKIWQCGTQLSKLMAVAHHMPLIADCFCPSWSSRGSRLGLPGSWSKPSMTPTKERCSSH